MVKKTLFGFIQTAFLFAFIQTVFFYLPLLILGYDVAHLLERLLRRAFALDGG